MKQRATQTTDFWQSEFAITDQSIENLYNNFLETGEPSFIDEIGLFFVDQIWQAEEEAIKAELKQGKPYQPSQSYGVGDKIVFSHLNFSVGTVIETRDGYNPTDEDFTVIKVEFDELGGKTNDFAASLKTDHVLSATNGQGVNQEDTTASIQKIYGQYKHLIRPKIEQTLKNNSEFIQFNQQWFLKDLLVEIQEGLLNIVDAAIDINGAPLIVDELIEQIELQKNGKITEALRFSVNYRLESDARFMNVGLEDIVLWYLNRLKPTQTVEVPHNLKVDDNVEVGIETLSSEFLNLLTEIDDEATPRKYAKSRADNADEVSLILIYPHRRSGTLPILASVQNLLPNTDGKLVALQFVDGQTGDEMVVWYVSQHRYIFGLHEWYQKHKLPVGAFIILQKTDNPLKFVIDFIPQRSQQEWIRVAMVQNDQLVFGMKKRPISCRYDELMIIGEEGSDFIDAMWVRVERQQISTVKLLQHIFPELMKLSSQHAVHIKTLYSAINVTKRCPPGILLQELANHSCFSWVGHGYWTYKTSKD